MVSCLVIAWLILATLAVVVAGVIAVGVAIALTNALLQTIDTCVAMVTLVVCDGLVIFDLARALAVGVLVAVVLGWVEGSVR